VLTGFGISTTTCIFRAMKRHINLIIILMAVCIIAVTGLQLFWNYQNYRSMIKNFNHDINQALQTAVDQELDARQQVIINQMKGWMSDTSFVKITCNTNNRQHKTVFTMRDVHPYSTKEKGISLSVNTFKPQLNTITPAAKQFFINHFANNIVLSDLKKGFIYYYTQRLGDSLQHAFFTSKLDLLQLKRLYKQELFTLNISSAFFINPLVENSSSFITRSVNSSLRRPYEKEWVKAGFKTPGLYFIRQMKWVVLTTLILVVVIVLCFGYTTRILLSQHKLAELKNNFINNMTHELNTPLSSIKITVEALNTYNQNPTRLKEYLGIISYQTERLSELSHQILNTNTIVRLKNQNLKPVILNALIKQSLEVMSPQIEKCGARLSVEASAETIVNADSESLINAFNNIIDNALKYKTSEQPVLSISITKNKHYAEVNFADNGPGIPQKYHSHVFDQFFRVPYGNQHDVKGYGLGLSYVKEVMLAHHGKVYISANTSNGSTFTLQFPFA